MPEGPECETVRRALLPKVSGQIITKVFVSDKKLRTAVCEEDFASSLGRSVQTMGRKGKLLWLALGGGRSIRLRLGMTGVARVVEYDSPRHKHTHIEIYFSEEKLQFTDPRRFGEVVPMDDAELMRTKARLGGDPSTWDDDERIKSAAKTLKSARTIKDILLDQSVFSGVGNIYASEVCFYAGIRPTRPGCELGFDEMAVVLDACEAVLLAAIESCGTTFRDFAIGNGKYGENQNSLAVFQREGKACPRCAMSIVRIVQSGRSSFYCPRCQL